MAEQKTEDTNTFNILIYEKGLQTRRDPLCTLCERV